jgi:arsenate reductase
MRSTSHWIVSFGLVIAFCDQTHAQGVAKKTLAPPRVVFVCEHGSVKSLVAMLYFDRKAQERGLGFRAIARGTAAEASVPGAVRYGLLSDGFDVSAYQPRPFKTSDLDRASLVVSFDQDIGRVVGAKRRYMKWDDLPGVLNDYAQGRDEIVRHVDALIDELARGSSP